MSEPARFSIARLAVFAMGSGALVLLVSVPVIYGVSRVSAPAALVVALLAIALAVAVMGIVANRIVNRAVDSERSGADTAGPPSAIERDRDEER